MNTRGQSSSLKYWLIDAVLHQKAHPASFELPDEWNRCHVGVGEHAKLIFAFPTEPEHTFERMWVQVVDVLSDRYHAVLANEPARTGFVSKGDQLAFRAEHIISIWPPRVYSRDAILPPPHG